MWTQENAAVIHVSHVASTWSGLVKVLCYALRLFKKYILLLNKTMQYLRALFLVMIFFLNESTSSIKNLFQKSHIMLIVSSQCIHFYMTTC